MNTLFTFERLGDGDELFVHADPASLRNLAEVLTKLAAEAEAGLFPHEHLFTESWGGKGLTSLPQEVGGTCIQQVKIYGWRGSHPYRLPV